MTKRQHLHGRKNRRLFFEQFEDRRMLDATPWTNPALAEDVDSDTFVTGTDAHIIVEMLIASGGQPVTVPMEGVGPPFPDVDGDGMVGVGDWEESVTC